MMIKNIEIWALHIPIIQGWLEHLCSCYVIPYYFAASKCSTLTLYTLVLKDENYKQSAALRNYE